MSQAVNEMRGRIHDLVCERCGFSHDQIYMSGSTELFRYNDAFKDIAAEMLLKQDRTINDAITHLTSLYYGLMRLQEGIVPHTEIGELQSRIRRAAWDVLDIKEALQSAIHGQDESSLPQRPTPSETEASPRQERTTALSTCASPGSPGRYSRFSSHRGLGRRTLAR